MGRVSHIEVYRVTYLDGELVTDGTAAAVAVVVAPTVPAPAPAPAPRLPR